MAVPASQFEDANLGGFFLFVFGNSLALSLFRAWSCLCHQESIHGGAQGTLWGAGNGTPVCKS